MRRINDRLVCYASDIADNTIEQAIKCSQMPFIYPHIALMPDAHLGKGATVGSVIPTIGAVMPSAVGVDLGCGMNAVKLCIKVADLEAQDLSEIREAIESVIPMSAGKYCEKIDPISEPYVRSLGDELINTGLSVDDGFLASNWPYQLGTLGGGNHFVEISADENDDVWLFLHSGSRGVGNKIAQNYINLAKEDNERRFIKLPDPDLAYLVEGDDLFDEYIAWVDWAQDFAASNRMLMIDRALLVLTNYFGDGMKVPEEYISCHHNYLAHERHFGNNVYVTRKGAISARNGQWGLIPGSMGTASYIVKGNGDRLGLTSAPHGAGRDYSRNEARKRFTYENLEERMKGIEWRHSERLLDEIPDAYKDIETVMEDSKSLVTPFHTLHQLVNMKGD